MRRPALFRSCGVDVHAIFTGLKDPRTPQTQQVDHTVRGRIRH